MLGDVQENTNAHLNVKLKIKQYLKTEFHKEIETLERTQAM